MGSSILFVSTMGGAPWGGSEELWSQAAACLLGRVIAVHVCVKASTARHPTFVHRFQTAARVHVWGEAYPLSRPRRLLQRWGIVSNGFFDVLDRHQFDLVVISCGWQFEAVDWAEACRQRGLRYAILVQSVNDRPWIAGDSFRLGRARECFDLAAATYFISSANQRLLETQLAMPLANARLVRNPFAVPFRAIEAWPSDAGMRLACVARLDVHSKGQDILLQALEHSDWRQRDWMLTFIGEGADTRYLSELAKFYGLSNVAFEPSVANVQTIWRSHHALVLPSYFEGLPLSVVEAMLCGRPCIVTPAAGGEGELVVDGENGFVARAPTAEHLHEALDRAWQRRAEWPDIGRRAAAHVQALFPERPDAAFADELHRLLSSSVRNPNP